MIRSCVQFTLISLYYLFLSVLYSPLQLGDISAATGSLEAPPATTFQPPLLLLHQPIINYTLHPPLSLLGDYLTPQAWQLCSPVGITSLPEQPCY